MQRHEPEGLLTLPLNRERLVRVVCYVAETVRRRIVV